MDTPISISEYRELRAAEQNSEEYVRALVFTQQVRKTVRQFDKGLLTPGDVLFQVVSFLTEWAGE